MGMLGIHSAGRRQGMFGHVAGRLMGMFGHVAGRLMGMHGHVAGRLMGMHGASPRQSMLGARGDGISARHGA